MRFDTTYGAFRQTTTLHGYMQVGTTARESVVPEHVEFSLFCWPHFPWHFAVQNNAFRACLRLRVSRSTLSQKVTELMPQSATLPGSLQIG